MVLTGNVQAGMQGTSAGNHVSVSYDGILELIRNWLGITQASGDSTLINVAG